MSIRRPGGGPRPGRSAGAGAGPGGRGGGFRYGTGGDIDLDDLLGGLFGGRAGRGWGPMPGADQEAEIELSVEEAYHGGRRQITLGSGPGGARTLQVTIPAGVTDGQRIRLAGQGGRGSDGGQPGDLYLVVRIASTRSTGWRAATCTSSCGSRRGRPRWALRSRWTRPAARPR